MNTIFENNLTVLNKMSSDVTIATPQIIAQQQPSLVATLPSLYKKENMTNITNVNSSTIVHTKVQQMNNNGQRVQTLNVQRQFPQIQTHNKVQVLSNVVVPKHPYVLNKGAVNNIQRQTFSNTYAQKTVTLNSSAPKSQTTMKQQVVNNKTLQQSQMNMNYQNHLQNNVNRNQISSQSVGKVHSTNQTHVISRVVTPGIKSTKTTGATAVQRGSQQMGGIKTISPQSINTAGGRIANNMVVQQRSGIKTIPPQRPNTYTKSAQKMSTGIKHNNYSMKNSHVYGTNKVSSKNKTLIMQSQTQPGNVVKYNGQQYQVVQQPVTASHQPITVVRTVASYEDNNVPTGIANALFSSQTPNMNITENKMNDTHVSQDDNYTSEDENIGVEVRPDIMNPQNIVLFDHNYHLPPPENHSPSTKLEKPEGSGLIPNGMPVSSQPLQQYYGTKSANPRLNNVNYSDILNQQHPALQDDDAASAISSDAERDELGEETETAPEGEGEEDSVTRCICDFEHDDGYMICCDKCYVWQHVDCMFVDRQHIQEEYLCEKCEPRRVNKQRARSIQLRKREEILNNGSSSDTSSGISIDTPINNNMPNKKRQPQLPVRKKNEPNIQKKPPVSVATQRRSRRDSNREIPPPVKRNTVVKRRQEKKVTAKRKMKPRRSQDENDDSLESWERGTSSTSVLQLRQWIENYEEAVTNHYSPELRARIMKLNGQYSDVKSSGLHTLSQSSPNVHKCKVVPQPNLGTKILVATLHLGPNSPVIELRGKYMLGSPQNVGSQSVLTGRHHAQRPGPFLFFYKLPKDGVEVCVDTRTYGNDARFVRRSCRPNAEVRHCIEKGTLHLYLVTITNVEKNRELTIKHEPYSLMGSNLTLSCACGNPAQCLAVPQTGSAASINNNNTIPTMAPTRRSNSTAAVEVPEQNIQNKRRGRRTISLSEHETPQLAPPVAKIAPPPPPPPPVVAPPPPIVPPPLQSPPVQNGPIRRSSQLGKTQPKIDDTPVQQPVTPTTTPEKQEEKEAKDKKKMTREERKMEAIMKAFERLEKEQRKQESRTRQTHKRDSDVSTPQQQQNQPNEQQNNVTEQRVRRKKKGRARTISTTSSGRRRTRLNSTDSYMTSGDENSLMSPPLPMSEPGSVTVAQPLNSNGTDEGGSVSGAEGHAAGLLLALANGGPPNDERLKSPDPDNCSSSGSYPGTPLSSNCLLVAAAVEQITPGFKFPKTKKAIMNEWLNKSPETVQPAASPILSITQPNVLKSAPDSPQTLSVVTDGQPTCRQSLVTLVQAANMCASPRITSTGSGNAKKRWLRQAISEECDSPNSRPDSPPAEMAAPPKKRRLARESMSSEQSFTPPTTPTCHGQNITVEEFEDLSPNQEEDYYVDEKINDFENDSNSLNERSGDVATNHQADDQTLEETQDVSEKVENTSTEIGCVYVEQNETEDLSPGVEPDAMLKERVAEMQLEFGGNVKCVETLPSPEISNPVTERQPAPPVPTMSLLDPRLRYHDSSQLIGTVEKSVQLYEQILAGAVKADTITPAKRKLSISEYRQRKRQGSSVSNDQNSNVTNHGSNSEGTASAPDSPRTRPRSNSASSTSSLSSDDELKNIKLNCEEKDKGVGATVKFNSAPTLVERQRENLTARLKLNLQSDSVATMRVPIKTASNEDVLRLSPSYSSPLVANPPPPEDLPVTCFSPNSTEVEAKIEERPIRQQNELSNGPVPVVSSVNYVPPFNNPIYPNSMRYTNFVSESPIDSTNKPLLASMNTEEVSTKVTL